MASTVKPPAKTRAEIQQGQSVSVPAQPEPGNIVHVNFNDVGFALGLISPDDMVSLDAYGYMPMRADVTIPAHCREPIKRLVLTLDATEAKLNDGTLVKASVRKAVTWLIERYAETVPSNNS